MSKYNKYAKQLQEAFNTTKQKANQLHSEYLKAKEEYNSNEIPAKYNGMMHKDIMRLRGAEFQSAKANYETGVLSLWDEYERERDRITKAFKEEFAKGEAVNSNRVDQNTVTLLNSGICTPNDLQQLLKQHEGNTTMQRLIVGQAEKMVQNADSESRGAYYEVVRSYNENAGKALHEWNRIVLGFNASSGRREEYITRTADYAITCANNTEKFITDEMIDNF